MISQQHIIDSIEKAIAAKSKLNEYVLNIRGFSTPTIRHLINNLCNIEGAYLEVGLLCGATFCASFNDKCTSVGVEDFSENFQADIPNYNKEELQGNVDLFSERAKEVHVHYESFLNIDKNLLPKNIDIYYYDGEHGVENQSVALPEFFDNMNERFVFIVDDCNWPQVTQGTGVGFKFLRKKIWVERIWELGKGEENSIWWNGVNIYLCRKK